MSGCREVLRFFGLPDSVRLTVRAGAAAEGRFVSVRLCEPLRPSWLGDEPLRLWLERALPAAAGPGEVWGLLQEGEERRPAIVADDDGVHFLFDPDEVIGAIQTEGYFEPRRPLHSRLALPYQLVPGDVRLFLFRQMLRWRRGGSDAGFPATPVEPSLEALRGAVLRAWQVATGSAAEPTFWPEGARYALVLSHDVDTRSGFARIPEIAALEERYGFRSTWFVVGNQFPLDYALLEGLRARGHEIALHGDRHDNRLAYQSRDRMQKRLDGCAGFVRRLEAHGFRSPSLLETPALREELRARFRYTSDVPDAEEEALTAPRRGCASCFPFRRQGLLEIPITLPFDDKLLLSGCTESGLLDAWRVKLAWIRAVGGLAQLLLHAEPHLWRRTRTAYARWLEERAADSDAWRASLGGIAEWWREREAHG